MFLPKKFIVINAFRRKHSSLLRSENRGKKIIDNNDDCGENGREL